MFPPLEDDRHKAAQSRIGQIASAMPIARTRIYVQGIVVRTSSKSMNAVDAIRPISLLAMSMKERYV